MSLDLCVISGTVYKPDSTAASLIPAPGAKLYVQVEAGSVIVGTGTMRITADDNGLISFSVPRNSDIFVQGNATIGSSTDLTNGKSFSVPDASTATLESLAAVSTTPATGLTVTGLAHKVGTLSPGNGVEFSEPSAGVLKISSTAPIIQVLTSTNYALPTAVGIANTIYAVKNTHATLNRNVVPAGLETIDGHDGWVLHPSACYFFASDGINWRVI